MSNTQSPKDAYLAQSLAWIDKAFAPRAPKPVKAPVEFKTHPAYLANDDLTGCYLIPLSDAVFRANYSVNGFVLTYSNRPIGDVLGKLSEADALWMIRTAKYERGWLNEAGRRDYEWNRSARAIDAKLDATQARLDGILRSAA